MRYTHVENALSLRNVESRVRDLLARVLGVVDGAQEPERKVEHEPARGPQQFLQRLAVACDGLVHQVELRFFR